MSTALTLNDLKSQLAARLSNTKDQMPPPTSTRIRLTLGQEFEFPDGTVTGGPIFATILTYTWFNAYYKKAFRAGEVSNPDCWATNVDANALAPHESVTNPVDDTCETCPNNQWDSGRDGRGKACGNKARLVLLAPDPKQKPTLYVLDLAPTSQGEFVKYLRTLERGGTHPPELVTQISFDTKVQYSKLNFKAAKPLPDELVPVVMSLLDKADDMVQVNLSYDD